MILTKMVSLILIISSLTTSICQAEETEQRDNTHIDYIWNSLNDEDRMELPPEYLAYICGMSEDDFIFMARVVEAEAGPGSSLESKIMVAACILDRVNSSYFPDTVNGVLTQSGQFMVVSDGWCYTDDTQLSRWAIVEAQREIINGNIPTNLLYFNSVGYNNGTAYGCYGGNYFMTYG